MSQCIACKYESKHGITIDTSKSKTKWAEELDISEASIRRHLKHEKRETTDEDAEQKREHWTGDEGELTIVLREKISNEAILRKFGHDPNEVSIVGVLEETHWQMNGEWQHRYRFKTSRAPERIDVDPLEILGSLRSSGASESRKVKPGLGVFVASLNDTQLGKSEGGGTPETLKRVHGFIQGAKERAIHIAETRGGLDTLVILGGGDIIEGCTIYPNQSYSIDMVRRGQILAAVGLILHMIDELAPMFERVIVLVSRGNHGENRINGNRTTLYDNDDTMVFEMAQLATQRDPRLSHVEYIIAQDEAGVYADVAGWRLATTHGDVYGKGVAGATVDKKAQAWYKNMAMGRDPLGSADVLITHHWHHDKMSDWGACLWRQTPAQDGGSEYFRQATGEYSEPGMLTFVMRPECRYSDELVVR